jgi:purine nucleoside phosphorylase
MIIILSCVALATQTLTAMGGVLQIMLITGKLDTNSSKADSGVILGSALNGITTVQAFNMQNAMSTRYNKSIDIGAADRRKRGVINGVCFGYSQA